MKGWAIGIAALSLLYPTAAHADFKLPFAAGKQELPAAPVLSQATWTAEAAAESAKPLKQSACEQNAAADAFAGASAAGPEVGIVLRDILVAAGRPDIKLKFSWYESDIPNCRANLKQFGAFACSTGLLNMKVKTADGGERNLELDELGFVFAHEVGHIALGHTKGALEREQRAQTIQQLASLIGVTTMLTEAKWTKVAGQHNVELTKDSTRAFWLAAAYGQTLTDAACDLAGVDYAKREEQEADYFAADIAQRLGWDKAKLAPILTALRAQSELTLEATSKATQSSLQSMASQALLESALGQSLESHGAGLGLQESWKSHALKIGFSFYSDYKTRQGLAFHPDPDKRAQRLAAYFQAFYPLAQADLAADIQKMEGPPAGASPAITSSVSPEGFAKALAADQKSVKGRLANPYALLDAIRANDVAAMDAAAKTVQAGASPLADYSLSLYWLQKGDQKLGAKLAQAAATNPNADPDMIDHYAFVLVNQNKLAEAKVVLDQGAARFTPETFVVSRLEVAFRMKDAKAEEELRAQCVKSGDVNLIAACGQVGTAKRTQIAAAGQPTGSPPPSGATTGSGTTANLDGAGAALGTGMQNLTKGLGGLFKPKAGSQDAASEEKPMPQ